MKKSSLKKLTTFAVATAMVAGTFTGAGPLFKTAAADTTETNQTLELWYDEPAEADVYEIFASRKWTFAWSKDGVLLGDDNLEIGRNDKYNYTDGQKKNKVNDYPISLGGKKWDVTDAARQGVTWAKHALPIGNGSMGAMTFGYLDTEIIQMNEETLWTGGPGSEKNMASSNDGDIYGNKNIDDPAANMDALVDNAFTEFYSSMEDGGEIDNSKSTPYSNQNKSSNAEGLTPNAREQEGAYQSFAEMYIDFNQDITKAINYKRALNLNEAVTTVSYEYDDVTYERVMFASYPDDVMVYKVSASKDGNVNFTLRPEIPQMGVFEGRYLDTSEGYGKENYGKTGTVIAEDDTITLSGELNHNGMKFSGQYKVVTEGGTLTANNEVNNAQTEPVDNGSITVTGANEAYILISLSTDYVNDFDKDYSTGETLEEITARNEAVVEAAAAKGYDALIAAHDADYSELFDRATINLGEAFPADLPTDELLDAYKANYNGKQEADSYSKYLETLYYQYGRYMLIASSREGSLPANLQGIWNDTDGPAWNSDWHTNINLQMNYWLAESTNLAETATALVDYANSLRKPGRLTLAKQYGIGYDEDESKIDLETEDGFTFNCSTTARGFTGNINSNAAFAPTAVAFLAQNLYDYYAYTQDMEYLQSDIYPFLREACITYLQTLKSGREETDKEKLYVVPSYSSEQGQWTVGTYFDQQLVWQLFNDTIKAMEAMGIEASTTTDAEDEKTFITDDSKLLARLKDAIDRLDPVAIGKSGQIKEWQQEVKYNRTENGKGIGSDDHRHISQLVALYPGNYISKDNTDLIEASQYVLTKRTDVSTGWGLAHRLNLWARTGDGNHSYALINAMLATSTYDNLFDTHAPFQIDGNFGATAGMTEMLLQSQNEKIELLPALPDAWADGSFTGLVARGNFEIDCEWSEKTVDFARITSNAGGTLVLEGIDIKKVVDQNGEDVICATTTDGPTEYTIETKAGDILTIYSTSYEGDEKPLPTAESSEKPAETTGPSEEPDKTAEPSETPTPTDPWNPVQGDVNISGTVTLADANLALQAALGIKNLSEDVFPIADVNKDSTITLTDANIILKLALGIPVK